MFFFTGRRCQRNVDPLRQRQMQQGLHERDNRRSVWRHQGEQWSRSHELNQSRWSRWSNPRWTMSPNGMKLGKNVKFSQTLKKSFYMVLHGLTFQLLSCGPWSSSRSVIPQVSGIFWTLCVCCISIRFLFASLVFYLEVCTAMSMWGKASVQSNLVLKCWKKSVRSVRRRLTIELFGPFGPLWPDPLWFLCLGFCGSKAESWQPKAGLFAMSKDAESQTLISFLVIDEFHFHGHQGSDKSNLPNMKSWPLETPAAFGHTREGSTVKKSSFTHCRNFLTIWMWWSSIASPCIFKKSLSFPVMPWWCPHVTKSTRWQRDPPVCLRLNLSVFATQRFLVFLFFYYGFCRLRLDTPGRRHGHVGCRARLC